MHSPAPHYWHVPSTRHEATITDPNRPGRAEGAASITPRLAQPILRASKAAASRTAADWLAIPPDGDQPEQWLRSTLSLLLAVGRLLRSLRDQPVGGMKMCTLLIGSNQAVAAPPGAMILRTPFSTMVTP